MVRAWIPEPGEAFPGITDFDQGQSYGMFKGGLGVRSEGAEERRDRFPVTNSPEGCGGEAGRWRRALQPGSGW